MTRTTLLCDLEQHARCPGRVDIDCAPCECDCPHVYTDTEFTFVQTARFCVCNVPTSKEFTLRFVTEHPPVTAVTRCDECGLRVRPWTR